jgi:phage recombination protein Bet
MPNELDIAKPFEIVITTEQRELVKRTIAAGATDAELELFFYDCTRRGVHPLDKLIHFTKRNGKYTPITSIDMFRQRASESGEHVGTEDAVYTGEPQQSNFAASVTVYKKVQGERGAFTATARWSEYCPSAGSDFMWKKMPHLMLAKCAEALALRKAFPAQLHGLYTPEEMAQAETPGRLMIPQVRPKNDATMVRPERDRYTGEDTPEDGLQVAAVVPAPPVSPATQDAPAPHTLTAAEYARQQADKTPELYVDGYVGSFVPYQGSHVNEKGKKPGLFDVEDEQGVVLLRGVKYFDPSVNLASGPLRVYYRVDLYKGQEQYKLVRAVAL